MSMILEIINFALPAIVSVSFIIAILAIFFIVRILVKRYPGYKLLSYIVGSAAFLMFMLIFFYFAYSDQAPVYLIKALIAIPLIFIIPGFILYRAFIKENIGLGIIETFLLWILGSMLVSGWIGLILAEIGYFSLLGLLASLAVFCLALACIFNVGLPEISGTRPHFDRRMIPVMLILLLSILLFFHPYSTVYGGLDQGVYVNTGVNIADTGSVVIHDTLIRSIDSRAVSSFYDVKNSSIIAGVLYPGVYLLDTGTGEAVPQFFYLWPAWIAIFYSIFGLNIGLYVVSIFALLCVLSIYVAGKVLFDEITGLVASLLLALNFAIVWYSRDQTSEIFTLFLILGALYTFILFIRSKGSSGIFFGVLSALSIGETFLARIDTVFLLLPIGAYFAYIWSRRGLDRKYLIYLLLLAVVGAHALISALFVSTPYTADIAHGLGADKIYSALTARLPYVAAVFFVVVASFTLTVLFKDRISRQIAWLKSHVYILQYIAALLIVAAILYGYFLRPAIDTSTNGDNLIKLSWYLAGPAGIFFAGAGSILLLFKKPYVESCIFLSIFLMYAFFYTANAEVALNHPWWIRRFVPVVIPFAILCIAYLIDRVKGVKIKKYEAGKVLSLLILGLLVVPFGIADTYILGHVQYDGLIEDVHNLSDIFGDDSVVLYDGSHGDYYTSRVALPLRYVEGIGTLPINLTRASATQVSSWVRENKTVDLLDMASPGDIYRHGLPIRQYNVSWTVIQNMSWMPFGYFYMPDGVETQNHSYSIVQIKNETDLDRYVWLAGANWYDLEYWDNVPTRWESNNASIGTYSDSTGNVSIYFDVLSFDEPRYLQVYVNDVPVFEKRIDANITKVRIQTQFVSGYNVIRLYTPDETMEVDDILHNGDTRNVSFAVRNLSIDYDR